jgi:hypothetical protein
VKKQIQIKKRKEKAARYFAAYEIK